MTNLIHENMTSEQKTSLISTWLMNGQKLTRQTANRFVENEQSDPNELVDISGLDLAKMLGYSLNEYRLKFMPLKRSLEKYLGIAIDGDLIRETFFEFAVDQYARISSSQTKLEEDKELFRQKLNEVMSKPISEITEKDLDVIKNLSKVLNTLTNVVSKQAESPARAFADIAEGLAAITKQPDIHVSQENYINPRQQILNMYGDKKENEENR